MQPVARTKLYTPTAAPGLVRRQRLTDLLTAGLAAGHRLTVVSAPAGCGKTTAIAAWLRAAARAHGWLSLDAADNDPARFVAGLVAAAEQAVNRHIAPDLVALLNTPQLPPTEVLAAYLTNWLADAAAPLTIVLDDYHLISDAGVHRLVQYLVDHQPEGLHVVVSSRSDPPLPTARWRARGLLTEVRAADLRFSPDEADDFLSRTMGLVLPEGATAALESRTEGWAAGLQLAGLSLRGRSAGEAQAFVATFSGSHRFVLDYLVEEVLSRQPESVRDFLRQTAVVDRLSTPLCDALTGRSDAREILAALERENCFLIALDDTREWYRYHHLFRDVLRADLAPADASTAHGRAARWLVEHGQLAEAVGHAAATHDAELQLELARRYADELLSTGEIRALRRLLASLPDEVVARDAELAVHRIWCLFISGDMGTSATALDELLALSLPMPPRVAGRLACVRAWVAGMRADPAFAPLCAAAMASLVDDDPVCRSATLLLAANAAGATGEHPRAVGLFREAYEAARGARQPFLAMTALMDLCLSLNGAGRRSEAEHVCVEGIRAYSDMAGQPLPVTGMALIQLGWLRYEANDLAAAERHGQRGLEMCRDLDFVPHILSDFAPLLARIRTAQGDGRAAGRILAEAEAQAAAAGITGLAGELAALAAEAHLRLGDAEPARRLVRERGLAPATAGTVPSTQAVVLARLLLADGEAAAAEALLGRQVATLARGGLTRRWLAANLLRALALDALGKRTEATATLSAVVGRAACEGYVRLFLDEGAAAARLLPAVRDSEPTFVAGLLAAFADVGFGGQSATEQELSGPGAALPTQERLTARELELLQLLAEGRSNEEIAGRLFISLSTAKWHLKNIYAKLGVRTRTQAIAHGRMLGLLA